MPLIRFTIVIDVLWCEVSKNSEHCLLFEVQIISANDSCFVYLSLTENVQSSAMSRLEPTGHTTTTSAKPHTNIGPQHRRRVQIHHLLHTACDGNVITNIHQRTHGIASQCYLARDKLCANCKIIVPVDLHTYMAFNAAASGHNIDNAHRTETECE